jgi:GNAT superfamily N-acetyltransferase
MFNVKQMSLEDVQFAVQITDTMNWNLTEKDFEFMMSLEPEGCFVLLYDLERVGIATTVSFGKVGWIGNVVVNDKYRRKGAGSTLLRHAINYLKSKMVDTVGLYSYKEAVNFYTRLGFRRELEYTVLKGKALSLPSGEANIKSLGENDVQKIIDFDSLYFGASREKLLKKIASIKGNLCCYCSENGEIFGYVMAKIYDHYAEIGPLVCKRERGDVAEALLKRVLKELDGFEVSMCLQKREEYLVNMLLNAGFREEFPVVRMFSGPLVFRDCVYIAESLERG